MERGRELVHPDELDCLAVLFVLGFARVERAKMEASQMWDFVRMTTTRSGSLVYSNTLVRSLLEANRN